MPDADDSFRRRRWWEPEDTELESFTEVPLRTGSFWQLLVKFVGPGIMIAIAYIDPGNYSTDLSGGSLFHYKLLWSVLFAHILGYIFQVLVVMEALATGRTLSEECALEYPHLRFFLWLTAETSSVASDLGYVMGTATAFLILFKVPILWGVLLAACDTLLFMAIQALGHRKMELFCALLGAVVTGCCFVEIGMSGLPEAVWAGFIPFYHGISGGDDGKSFNVDLQNYILTATSIVGASVCPPNFFLHSALVQSRRYSPSVIQQVDPATQFKAAVKFNAMETGFGIFCAFLINTIVLIVAGLKYSHAEQPDSLTAFSDVLKTALGPASSIIFALSIFCGGQSASVTGTLASQFILEGFLKVRLKLWLRRILTRLVSVIPAFFITLAWGDKSADIINDSQVIVNFSVPFTLIPILKFVSSRKKMGTHKISFFASVILWAMMIFVTGLNLASAEQMFVSTFGNITGGILLGVLLVPYTMLILYIAWKPPTVGPDSIRGLAGSHMPEGCGQAQSNQLSDDLMVNPQVAIID